MKIENILMKVHTLNSLERIFVFILCNSLQCPLIDRTCLGDDEAGGRNGKFHLFLCRNALQYGIYGKIPKYILFVYFF